MSKPFLRERLVAAAAAAMFLAGCSWFTSRPVPVPDPTPDPAAATRILRPGPGPLVVGAVGATTAAVAWTSVWSGESVVVYSRTPDLMSALATPPTSARAALLTGLAPATRYFVRVETRTARGVARSAVCSFRTR